MHGVTLHNYLHCLLIVFGVVGGMVAAIFGIGAWVTWLIDGPDNWYQRAWLWGFPVLVILALAFLICAGGIK